MTKAPLLLIILMTATFICKAQENPPTEIDKIQKVVIDMFQQLSNRDADKLKTDCTADITVLENGTIWSFDSLQQKIDQNKMISDFSRVNKIEFIKTEYNANIAWTSYYNQAEITKNGIHNLVKWLESAVLIKEDDHWKIKMLHSTLIKRI